MSWYVATGLGRPNGVLPQRPGIILNLDFYVMFTCKGRSGEQSVHEICRVNLDRAIGELHTRMQDSHGHLIPTVPVALVISLTLLLRLDRRLQVLLLRSDMATLPVPSTPTQLQRNVFLMDC
jgi:hypothetical protein